MNGQPPPRLALTPRETEVLRSFALGRTWNETCADLGMTRKTLYAHWWHMREKAGAMSRVDVLRAIGWLRVP